MRPKPSLRDEKLEVVRGKLSQLDAIWQNDTVSNSHYVAVRTQNPQAYTTLMSYKSIIQALSTTICSLHMPDAPVAFFGGDTPDFDTIASDIIDQQRLLPDYLPLPIAMLTWLFECSGVFFGGRLFSNLPSADQSRQFLVWKNSPLGLCRNFVRLYESLFFLVAIQEPAGK